jgi:hypothetical protein
VTAAATLAQAGVPRLTTLLIGLGAIVFGISHAPPIGPAGMLIFLAGAAPMLELRRGAYNVLAMLVIFVLPLLRPIPLWCAEHFAALATEHKPLVAAYLVGVFIVPPALVIVVGVLTL